MREDTVVMKNQIVAICVATLAICAICRADEPSTPAQYHAVFGVGVPSMYDFLKSDRETGGLMDPQGTAFTSRLSNTLSYQGDNKSVVQSETLSSLWRLHKAAIAAGNISQEMFYQGDATYFGLAQNQRIIEQNDQIIALLTRIADGTGKTK